MRVAIISLVIVLFICGAFTQLPPSGYTPPTEIHFALTGDPTSVTFSWHTTLPTSESYVKVTDGIKEVKFTGNQTSYLLSAGWFHKVLVTGLSPSTKYKYIVGSSEGESVQEEFTTAPPEGTRGNFTFVVYGDMGIFQFSYPTVLHVTQLVQDGYVDMIYHAGDFGYGDDRGAAFYEVSWNLFFEQMEIAMMSVPYMTCVGNHEQSCGHSVCDFYSANYAVYNTRFNNMPSAQSGSNTTMWFSFDYGNVHFITISTETDYPDSPSSYNFGDQLSWLETDLINADNDPNIDWIIVVGHRPIYSSVNGFSSNGIPEGQCLYLQKSFEDLFHQYHVDLYFDGHVHGYERSYPVYQSKVSQNYTLNQYVNPDATTYIVCGSAGNIEGFYTNWISQPSWSAIRDWPDPTHGYGVLQINGADELRWTQYLDTASYNVDNNYFDWFQINRVAEGATPPNPTPPTPFK